MTVVSIVNATIVPLLGGGGMDSRRIHRVAKPELQSERWTLDDSKTGNTNLQMI